MVIKHEDITATPVVEVEGDGLQVLGCFKTKEETMNDKELNHGSVIVDLFHASKSAGEIVRARKYAKSTVLRAVASLKKSHDVQRKPHSPRSN
ncbi:Hypothetical predicted protein [Octopus vulgaris]|uniref:Uncharacterized protein n=1 Tax=Octopus vulgaris TaxID=6645 RepID=A0AA36ATE4_OCTVU|nr:Hypothetical predicted protein [Octopus vulgaris]